MTSGLLDRIQQLEAEVAELRAGAGETALTPNYLAVDPSTGRITNPPGFALTDSGGLLVVDERVPRLESPLSHGASGGTDDTAAVQAAITAAQQSSGGVVIDRPYNIPGGLTYDMGAPLRLINLPGGSLHATQDLGAGRYAIQAVGTLNDTEHIFDGLQLYGPGGAISPNVVPANMHGVQLCPRAQLIGAFYIKGFWAGYTFYGDHQVVWGGRAFSNYVGEYFEPNPYQGSVGDQLVLGVSLTQNALAGIRVSPQTNPIDGARHARVHLGFAPVGIWLEQGNHPITGTAIGGEASFDTLYFENIGNAHLYCDDAAGATNTINGSSWRNCRGYRRTDHTAAGLKSDRNIYNVNVFDDTDFTNCPAWTATGGSPLVAFVHADFIYKLEWNVAWESVNASLSNGIPLFSALTLGSVLLRGIASEYQAVTCTDVGVNDRGLPVVSSGLDAQGSETCALWDNNNLRPFLGVSLHPVFSTSAGLNTMLVCRRGQAPIKVQAIIGTGQWLVPNTTINGYLGGSGSPPAGGQQCMGYSLASIPVGSVFPQYPQAYIDVRN